jgi:hypothetical protein
MPLANFLSDPDVYATCQFLFVNHLISKKGMTVVNEVMESGLVGGQLTAPHRPTNIFNLANMVLKLMILVTSSLLTLKRHIR